MAFTKKLLSVQFDLANGQFDGGGNSTTITGLRTTCTIMNLGGAANSNMEMAIYGLPLSLMNQLSTVGKQLNLINKNTVTVMAGDTQSGMSLVFGGVIISAFVDASAMPQVAFRLTARPGHYHAMKPATPISHAGPTDAAQLMQTLAQTMGFGFENAGVTAKLTNPYYGGTAWTQALEIARHAGFDMMIDRNTMAIVPPDKTRSGDGILISPQTGMVGYPAFNQAQVVVTALFDPAVKPLGTVQIQSDLTPACGTWKVNSLIYELESMTPHGKWFMEIKASIIGPTPQ